MVPACLLHPGALAQTLSWRIPWEFSLCQHRDLGSLADPVSTEVSAPEARDEGCQEHGSPRSGEGAADTS